MSTRQYVAGPDGWSPWVSPVMKGYRMACCDCGLVHTMEFEVVRFSKKKVNGKWRTKTITDPDIQVIFRARRNNRSTAAIRRGKRKK